MAIKPPRWRWATRELFEDWRWNLFHPIDAVRTWVWDAYMISRCLDQHGNAFCKRRNRHRSKWHRAGSGLRWRNWDDV